MLRVLLALVVVLPGSFFLGATLPLLVRHVVRLPGEAGRSTAWLYGANTLGAVLGALATGFVLVEAFGVTGTVRLAAAVAASVGLVAWAVGRRLPVLPEPLRREIERGPTPTHARSGALALAAATGFLGLGLEMASFRLLVFFVEGFTATFAAMVGVFVLGLGLGSLLLGPLLARSRRPDRALAALLVLAGAALLLERALVLPGLDATVESVRRWAYTGATSPTAGLRWTAFVGSAVALLPPAFLLGATFPLAVRYAELSGLAPGEAVGRVYLANSLGTIVAPALVGFFLVPALGPVGAFTWLGVLALGLAAAALALGRRAVGSRRGALAGLVTLLAIVGGAVALWPAEAGATVVRFSHVLRGPGERRLLQVETDPVTTASVVDTQDGERCLYTDDFLAAATGRHYRYMRLLGHLPVLLADRPENALVIAFGTGTTAGAVAAHPEVRRIEVVEVSRAVLDLAPRFAEANRGVLHDPRVRVIHDDGRNVLLLHDADLDVITLEPLMPYAPAGYPFYTKEFYELARARLREGGVLCQWLPVHAMPAGLYAAFLRTFFDVFPDGSLWFFEQSTALVGRRGSAAPGPDALRRRIAAAKRDLADAGLDDERAVAAAFVASGRSVRAAALPPSSVEVRPVLDLDPWPEFHPLPRAHLNTTYLSDTLAWISTLVDSSEEAPVPGGDARLRKATKDALDARREDARAAWLSVERRATAPMDPGLVVDELEGWKRAAGLYDAAHGGDAHDETLVWRAARAHGRAARLEAGLLRAQARADRASGRSGDEYLQRAQALLDAALAPPPGDREAAERGATVALEAEVLLAMGRCGEARARLDAEVHAAAESSAEREALGRLLAAVEAHRAGRPFEADLAPALGDARPCGPEGAALVAEPLTRLAEALDGGDLRTLRLRADAVLADARAAHVASEAATRLRALPSPQRPEARAVLAALRDALDPGADALAPLLGSDLAAEAHAALVEAGRRRLLRAHPDAARSLAASGDETLRLATADAIAADGDDGLFPLAAPLLLDPSRDVRVAAASALWRRYPDDLDRYDPDGSEADRRAVVDALQKRFR